MLEVSEKQAFNEAILKLMLLVYKIDHKITLSEQDRFEQVKEELDWESPINIESFITHASGLVSQYVNEKRPMDLVRELREPLNYNAKLAVSLTQAMIKVDADVHEDEEEILHYLSTKLDVLGSEA